LFVVQDAGDIAHHPADIRGQAVERLTDHGFETLALDIDFEVIVRPPSPAGAVRAAGGRCTVALVTRETSVWQAMNLGAPESAGYASTPGRTSFSYECIEGA
jgi:hypothetical protein